MVSLNNVDRVPNSQPPTLIVEGQDFRYVEEVRVNEQAAVFVVTSKTRILVEIPEPLWYASVTTCTVLSRQFNMSAKSLLRFRLRRNPNGARGFLYLVQLFVKQLLTTPGTDIFSPARGGGVQHIVGRTFSDNEAPAILSDFVMAVDQATRAVQAIQSTNTRLQADERLVGAQVVSSDFDREQGALTVSIEIIPQSGRAGVVRLAA